ncbi:hypothetical protein RRF57_007665 [Xylaria bambusicola]|uniref:Uncharacterized protein n=1 Tax=Xylaria bambusicola TaxID=326684 RepID=A0AAN7USD7_9PEZI
MDTFSSWSASSSFTVGEMAALPLLRVPPNELDSRRMKREVRFLVFLSLNDLSSSAEPLSLTRDEDLVVMDMDALSTSWLKDDRRLEVDRRRTKLGEVIGDCGLGNLGVVAVGGVVVNCSVDLLPKGACSLMKFFMRLIDDRRLACLSMASDIGFGSFSSETLVFGRSTTGARSDKGWGVTD